MDVVVLIAGLGLLALLADGVRCAFDPRVATRRTAVLGRRVGLELDALVLDLVRSRLARRTLVGALGGLTAGAGIGGWFALSLSGAGVEGAVRTLVWTVMATLLGRAVAVAGLAVVDGARRRPRPGPRVARTGAPTFGDYVAPAETALAATVALVPVVVLAARLVTHGPSRLGPSVPAAVGLAALAVGGLVARRLTTGTRHATTTLALAWDDALRARALRDVTAAVGLAGVSYALLVTAVLGLVPGGPAVNTWATAVLWVPAVACAVLAALPGPGDRFRRRLWPVVPRALPGRTTSEVTS